MQINILGKVYNIVDSIERISISDSFVLAENKIGAGSGEAKLYVGQVGDKLTSFFGKRGFVLDCFYSQQNLVDYLNSAYSEYNEPLQNYRNKSLLSKKWIERKEKILGLTSVISFRVHDQDHITGPRLYVSYQDIQSKAHYELMRELSLPVITHLNIHKLLSVEENKYSYYFQLFLNEANDLLEKEITTTLIDDEISKFIPVSDDNAEIEDDILDDITEEAIHKEIQVPFDPNKIKIRTDPSTIGQIKSDLEHKIINLNTDFQRLPDLWDENKKSRFIESLLLRLPIPAFYFNEADDNTIEVVDGLQRISTIKQFMVDKKLKLKNLEFLKDEFDGKFYEDLPYIYQRRILTFPITTYIIEKGTPNEVKFNIFKRVNTGGLELTAQEIRHAINQGEPATLLAELVNKNTVEGKSFHLATDYKMSNSKRMEDRDFANRFVAFYLIDFSAYKPDLDTFLNNGLAQVKLEPNAIPRLKRDFKKSMDLAYYIFANDAFRKRLSIKDNRKPINKSIFDALSVMFAKLSDQEVEVLKKRKAIFRKRFVQLNNDLLFLRAITQGTAQKESVVKRFQEIDKIIKQTLTND